jgi:hypothetical protein
MSKKLPAFQFYPQDWRSDIGVQSLSLDDRMIWFEMLCVMHESDDRGKLILNGKPMPDEVVARLIGIDVKRYKKALIKIEHANVVSRDGDLLFNRRMVHDNHLINVRRECGKQGGNPKIKNMVSVLVNQNVNQTIKQIGEQNPPPSSSSSSSLSISIAQEDEKLRIEKKAVEELCEYFKVNEITNPNLFMKFDDFIGIINHQGKLEYFQNQFSAYREIHKKIESKYHCSPINFMGHLPDKSDGKWNAENWEHKLNLQSQPQPQQKNANIKQTIDSGARKDYSF